MTIMDIQQEFYAWAATYGEGKEEADKCKYSKDMVIEFAMHVVNKSDLLPHVISTLKQCSVGCNGIVVLGTCNDCSAKYK